MRATTIRKHLIGKTFGRLMVVDYSHHEQVMSGIGLKWRHYWDCKCECGNVVKVWTSHLTRGKKKSCGCICKPSLIGKRFVKGVVISEIPIKERKERNRQEWLLQCDCGNKYKASTSMLTGKVSRRTTSCGCRSKCVGKERWNFKGYEYSNSGAPDCVHIKHWDRLLTGAQDRGIEVLISREFAYELFVKQSGKCALSGIDISLGYKKMRDLTNITASLDRIDNRLGYTEDNVQWVHKHVNMMKRHHTQEQFIYLCKMVAANNQ